MADIRINALATTATTPASDDFLALDGTAQGTRKILATNIANNVTDVVFGTSGPSAKSSIAARAARQGLVFDGTSNGATFSGPAIGTGDVSVSTWVNTKSFTGCSLVGQIGGVFDLFDASNMRFYDASGPTNYNITIPTQSTDKWFMLTWVRSSGVLYGYVNGVLAGSIACTASMTAFNYLGSINTFNKLNGTLSGAYIYNRALTAAEVVSLYEAGVPSGSDYNTASNTAINTSNWNNSNWPYTSFTGVSSTAFTAVMSTVNIGIAEIIPTPVNGTAGQRIRITVSATLTSGATPTLRLFDASYNTVSNAVALTAGSNTVELVATAAFTKIGFYTSGVTSYAVSSVSVTRIGLLLAPDAAQAGGGLTWYDTSGNAANITLPASGVSWNVPSSLKTASGWTYGGTLTVAPASGTAATAVLSGTAAGSVLNYALNGTNKYTAEYVSASDFYAIGRSAVAYDLVMKSGNLLIGTTIDGGQKLQVNGTGYFAGNLTVSGTGTNLFGGGSRDAFVIESDTAGNGAFASAKNAAANDYEPLSLIGETITLKYRSGVNSSTAGLTLTSTGTTLAGTVIAPAATTAISSVRLPHGTAPTSPVNGDMWTTTAGLYVRINGVTVGPLS